MKNLNKEIGNYGEDLCAKYLLQNKFRILNRNYRTRNGEIDIVALNNNIIIFIEVKSRYSNSYGYPLESVTYSKQNKIKKMAEIYILNNKLKDINFRFDVIEVFLNTTNNNYKLNHIEDAFR